MYMYNIHNSYDNNPQYDILYIYFIVIKNVYAY